MTQTISVRLPDHLVAQLGAIAEDGGVTLEAFVVEILETAGSTTTFVMAAAQLRALLWRARGYCIEHSECLEDRTLSRACNVMRSEGYCVDHYECRRDQDLSVVCLAMRA